MLCGETKTCPNGQGVRRPPHPLFKTRLFLRFYQGTIFFRPFFLLLDSFCAPLVFPLLVESSVVAEAPPLCALAVVSPRSDDMLLFVVSVVWVPDALSLLFDVGDVSSASADLAGAGSPGFTVSTTAGEVPAE